MTTENETPETEEESTETKKHYLPDGKWQTEMFMDRVHRTEEALMSDGHSLTMEQLRKRIQDGDGLKKEFRILILKKIIYAVENALPRNSVADILKVRLPRGEAYHEWIRSWDRRRATLIRPLKKGKKYPGMRELEPMVSARPTPPVTMAGSKERTGALPEDVRAVVRLLKVKMGDRGYRRVTVVYNGPMLPADIHVELTSPELNDNI